MTSAAVDDAQAAPRVLEQLTSRDYPRLKVIWADSKYHNYVLYNWKDSRPDLRWRLEIVRRPPGSEGFVLLPMRWVVERTFAWLGRSRRLSKDYERRVDSGECMIRLRGIETIVRRFAPKLRPPFNYRDLHN